MVVSTGDMKTRSYSISRGGTYSLPANADYIYSGGTYNGGTIKCFSVTNMQTTLSW